MWMCLNTKGNKSKLSAFRHTYVWMIVWMCVQKDLYALMKLSS